MLGSSSRVAEEIDLSACTALGVGVLRRPSGGLTVVLGPGCLMWSVVLPHAEAAPSIDRIHAAVLKPLAAALSEARGLPVVRRGSSDLAIMVDGMERKVSGNAVRVRRHAVLYHGTLLDSFDLGLISRVLPVRPEPCGIAVLPAAISAATRARQSGPPSSQSKLAVCSASRFGPARGSRILAKETRLSPGESGVTSERAKISPSTVRPECAPH